MIMTREMPTTTTSQGGRLVATDGRELPLASVHLASEAGGGIARTVLTQRFENPFDEPLQVRYLLPLPSDGAVSGFAFTVGNERVEGEVAPRAAARERFEQALVEGRTAALLDQERTSVFTQHVGNIPPRTSVIAEITVDQPLRWLEEGAWEWRFPTVVAPRYQGELGRVADAAKISVPVASGEIGVRASLALTIADATTGFVESPSHQLGREGKTHGLAEGSARLDRDLVVRWPVALPTVSANVLAARPSSETHGGDAFALVTIAPPNEAALAQARDLTFLIDTSGSMGGRPLEQAKRILTAMIGTLGPEDRLEMIEFGSAPRRWKAEPLLATEPNKQAALAWLEALRSSGGTEMRRAIVEALRPLRKGSQRQVVLVTDGYIGFEREIVETLLEKLPAGARLHTVGVGGSVNRSLTQAAARAGRGVEVLVGLEEDPDRVVPRLLARTTAPLVTDLVLEGEAIVESAPRRLPDLFVESPALFALRVRSQGGEVVLRGATAEGTFERRLVIPALAPGEGPRAIAALFAREKVEDLETHLTAGGDRAEIEKAIELTGVAFQISTRLTSWVAVSKQVTVEPGRAPKFVEQPHELPHGVSAEGLGLRRAGGGGRPSEPDPRFLLAQGGMGAIYKMTEAEAAAQGFLPPPAAPRPTDAKLGSYLEGAETKAALPRDPSRLTRSGSAHRSSDMKLTADGAFIPTPEERASLEEWRSRQAESKRVATMAPRRWVLWLLALLAVIAFIAFMIWVGVL
jgi:Ca-activated chloride channel family protein